MLRKTTLIGILFLLLANPCFSGFYLGAGFGPEGGHFRQWVHVAKAGTFDAIDVNHFSGIGMFGTLFGGYGWKHNWFFLALEGNANLSSVEYKLTNRERIHRHLSVTTFTVKNSEGVGILPGIFLSDMFLLYGRVGYANGWVKIRESDSTIRSVSTNRDGIRYGAGIRYNMFSRWTFMMDYSQINYNNTKGFVFEPSGGVGKLTKIYPNTAQVAFGVIYNFDVPEKAFVK